MLEGICENNLKYIYANQINPGERPSTFEEGPQRTIRGRRGRAIPWAKFVETSRQVLEGICENNLKYIYANQINPGERPSTFEDGPQCTIRQKTG